MIWKRVPESDGPWEEGEFVGDPQWIINGL